MSENPVKNKKFHSIIFIPIFTNICNPKYNINALNMILNFHNNNYYTNNDSLYK